MVMKINDIKRSLRNPNYSGPGDEELRLQHVQVVRQVTDLQNALTAAASISPLTTKGDIWGFNTVDDRIPIGANGYLLTADSAQAFGLKWAAAPTGVSVTTKGDLQGYSTVPARVPVGTNNQVLIADSTQTLGVKWSSLTPGKRMQAPTSGAQDGSNKVFVWEAFTAASETLYINGVATDPADYTVTNVSTGEITLGSVLFAPVAADELRLSYLVSGGVIGGGGNANTSTGTEALRPAA